MARNVDHTGERFGRLVVTGRSRRVSRFKYWDCDCDCGYKTTVRQDCLRNGETQSCGCYQLERIKEVCTKHGHATRGETNTYKSWKDLLSRCENLKDKNYKNYGGRGITVCESWHEFANFLADMGEAPKHLTIERIDNNKGYSKENCRWATRAEQTRNQRSNIKVAIDGQTKCFAEWAVIFGVNYSTATNRLYRGWDAITALTTPAIGK